jgi:hypothetical protein
MVRLKFSVTPTKQSIGVVFNRNKTEGSGFLFFTFAGVFLAEEVAIWRREDGRLVIISPG